eukprot:PhF_6_TR34200/c0_g1_i4/m.50126
MQNRPSDIVAIMEAAQPPLLRSSGPLRTTSASSPTFSTMGLPSSTYQSVTTSHRYYGTDGMNYTSPSTPTDLGMARWTSSPRDLLPRPAHSLDFSVLNSSRVTKQRSQSSDQRIDAQLERERERALEIAREVEREKETIRAEAQERLLEKEKELEQWRFEKAKVMESDRLRSLQEEIALKEEAHRRELERIRERERARESQRASELEKKERMVESERLNREAKEREERLMGELRKFDRDMAHRLQEIETSRVTENHKLQLELESERRERADIQQKLTAALNKIEEAVNHSPLFVASSATGQFGGGQRASPAASFDMSRTQDEIHRLNMELQHERQTRISAEEQLVKERKRNEESFHSREDELIRPWKEKLRNAEYSIQEKERECSRLRDDTEELNHKIRTLRRNGDSGDNNWDRSRLEDELRNLQREKDKLLRETKEAQADTDRFRSQIESLNKQLEQERSELKKLRDQESDTKISSSRREREQRDQHEADMDSMKKKFTKQEDECKEIKDKLKESEDIIARLKKEKEDLSISATNLERNLRQKTTESDEIKTTYDRQLNELKETARKDKEGRQQVEAQLVKWYETDKVEKEKTKLEREELNAKIKNLEADVISWKDKFENRVKAEESLSERASKSEMSLETLQKEIDSLRSKYSQASTDKVVEQQSSILFSETSVRYSLECEGYLELFQLHCDATKGRFDLEQKNSKRACLFEGCLQGQILFDEEKISRRAEKTRRTCCQNRKSYS